LTARVIHEPQRMQFKLPPFTTRDAAPKSVILRKGFAPNCQLSNRNGKD
jgi:hypothetical protein